jgi:phosphohistidine phosphatase
VPDLALVSPSARTRETWELFRAAFPSPPPQHVESRLYAAPVERLREVVRETAAEISSLLLVGHNPGLEELALALVGGGSTDALIRFGGSMPTASLAVIDVPGRWVELQPRTGRLEFFVTPKSLGEQDD